MRAAQEIYESLSEEIGSNILKIIASSAPEADETLKKVNNYLDLLPTNLIALANDLLFASKGFSVKHFKGVHDLVFFDEDGKKYQLKVSSPDLFPEEFKQIKEKNNEQ